MNLFQRSGKWYFILFLLVGCQASTSYPDLSATPEAIVPGLPSIAELAGTPAPDIPPLPALDPALVALGRQVYDQHCAECHGENLEGESEWKSQNSDGSFRAPPHDATGHTWHHGDKVLVESINFGGSRLPDNIGGFSNMPPYNGVLTEEEITAVLAFIKSSWPEDVQAIQWEQTVREP